MKEQPTMVLHGDTTELKKMLREYSNERMQRDRKYRNAVLRKRNKQAKARRLQEKQNVQPQQQ